MKVFKYFVILTALLITAAAYPQSGIVSGSSTSPFYSSLYNKHNNSNSKPADTLFHHRAATTPNIGGIFIAPMLGASYPIGDLSINSKGAFNYGFRIEYSSTKIYPFIISGFLELQKFPGSDEFKVVHLLDVFETKTTSLGGNIDIVLSRYLKSNFTTPFITLEARMINATRTATPEANVPADIVLKESQLAYGGGAGFTLFIFDLSFKYLKAKSYSMFLFNTRFHIPLVKF